jgi:glycosyltransferase involved in cell wall biosynthesis
MGRRVVYDVHEDFAQAAAVRAWIPRPLRPLMAAFSDLMAALAGRAFRIVIAERYYARRFPGATPVLNYPHPDAVGALSAVARPAVALPRIRLVYAGSVTPSRGALLHADLLRALPGAELVMVGHCPPGLVPELRRRLGAAELVLLEPGAADPPPATARSRLVLEGVGRFVPHARIVERLAEPWTAGLALFPASEHYLEKELTKLFEYMAAGLPLVVSDFPAWRELVEASGAGLCVDPEMPEAAAQAVRRLHADPTAAARMGERGRQAVAARFTWPSQAANLLALYREMLGPG